jgi:phenylacetate-CoA ligase
MSKHVIRSAVPGLVWPAIPSTLDSEILALQYQLDKSQWYSADKLADLQLQQASNLLQHAVNTVPYYQDKPAYAVKDITQLNWETWRSIPLLEKKELQQFNDQFVSTAIPPAHLPLSAGVTSSSTTPVYNIKTRVTGLMWMACSLREHMWHDYVFGTRLAVIKYFDDPAARSANGARQDGWGQSTDMLLPRGNTVLFDIRHTIQEQMQWMVQQQPDYLVSYPSNLAALAELFIENSIKLKSLRSISTLGEILTPRHRELFREAWGMEVHDIYSSEEMGFMAVQCPTAEHYHVQSEHIILEVLDDNGLPCKPGEIGRVVLTTLNNFAKPLIRYVIGDYAEVGSACACGRGLPVINRIIGRVRNMFVRPDGQVFWPVMPNPGSEFSAQMPAVRQYQYVQKSPEWIEIRIAIENPPCSPKLEAALVDAMQKEYGYPFRITFAYMKSIPSRGREKYEEFLNEIA